MFRRRLPAGLDERGPTEASASDLLGAIALLPKRKNWSSTIESESGLLDLKHNVYHFISYLIRTGDIIVLNNNSGRNPNSRKSILLFYSRFTD